MYVVDLITHLRSFVAVAESGSVTTAAAEIRVPQPVVSRRIMALEKHLGTALFTRTGRRVHISGAGKRLLPHAIDLVTRADHFLELAAAARDRRLRVGVPPDADLQEMAAASVAAKSAGFEIDVITATREVRQTQLAGGGLQIALLDSAADTADIVVPIGVGTASTRGSSFHLDELRRRRNAPPRMAFLCPEDDVPELRRQLAERMARAGLSPAQFEVTESVAGAVTRVHAGDGVLLCSAQAARRHGLNWQRLGGAPLMRCYAIAIDKPAARDVLEAIGPHLRDAVGGTAPADAVTARSLAPAREDVRG